MNWIYIAVTFGLAAVAWCVIRSDVRKTLEQARASGYAGPLHDADTGEPVSARALDAAMERIVTPGTPVPYRLPPALPVGSLHACGCFAEYLPGGDASISPCPRHKLRGDWITWEQQMREGRR